MTRPPNERDVGPKRKTRRHPNECPECEGYGDTNETKPDARRLGSGCPICLGVGRIEPLQVVVTMRDGSRVLKGTGALV